MSRYSRHEIIIGKKIQKKISRSWVAVIGLGGTGSVAAEFLSRFGFNLILIDHDTVDITNLNRQMYAEEDIEKPKAFAMEEKIKKINKKIKTMAYFDSFSSEIVKGVDFILDCTDNMESRFVINDTCMKYKIPFVYTAAIKKEGMLMLVIPGETPCLSCIFKKPSAGAIETCETAGVMPTITAMVGILGANEVIKYFSGSYTEGLFRISADGIFESIKTNKKEGCDACSGLYKYLDKKSPSFCGAFEFRMHIDINSVKKNLKKSGEFKVNSFKDFIFVSYQNKNATVTKNKLIVKNAKSEKDAKSFANKIVSF